MQIGQREFTLIGPIAPETDAAGALKEFTPAQRYKNDTGLALNAYGRGAFCKFRLPTHHPELGALDLAGVYALVDGAGAVLYAGKCENLERRFNMGYGSIAPRNCYQDGQSTNCRINHLILAAWQAGGGVRLFFHPTPGGPAAAALETELIQTLTPPWNRSGTGRHGSTPSRLAPPGPSGAAETSESAASPPNPPARRAIGELRDAIRQAAIEHYFEPARRQGKTEAAILALDMAKLTGIANRYPAICLALRDKFGELQRQARVELLGDGHKDSSATAFTYRLLA